VFDITTFPDAVIVPDAVIFPEIFPDAIKFTAFTVSAAIKFTAYILFDAETFDATFIYVAVILMYQGISREILREISQHQGL